MHAAHYLVVDLEATCANDRSIPRFEMEIIEIGAVMVCGQSLQTVDEFHAYVRPVRNPRLTSFCTELTGIRQDQVDAAEGFAKAWESFTAWVFQFEDPLFCSWGAYDRRQFEQDCLYHRVDYVFGSRHFNLKIEFAHRVGRRPMGVVPALRYLGLPFTGRQHSGIDDARNIVKMLPFILGRAT